MPKYTLMLVVRSKFVFEKPQTMWERLHNKKPQVMEQVFDSIITHHNLATDTALALETVWKNRKHNMQYYSTECQLAQLMLESLGNIIKLEISETKVH
jgi:hypothetical protein